MDCIPPTMRILSLELNGYIRLCWNQIRHFIITFDSNEHLILGTNGAGKSRLLSEIAPNPPVQSDFTKDGSAIKVYEHHGKIYTLSTHFGQKAPHSFLIDGEEQNEGGTVTVQRDLVAYHFKYTNEVRALLQQKEVFTLMSPARRREWFTRFSDVDQAYALEQYHRYKSLNSQAAAGVQFLKRKLATEIEKQQSMTDITQLEQQVMQLQNQLKDWVAHRVPQMPSPEAIKGSLEALLARLDTQGRVFLTTPYIVPEHDPALQTVLRPLDNVTPESLVQHIRDLENQSASYQSLLDQDVGDHDRLTESIAALRQLNQVGLQDLQRDIQALEAQISQLKGQQRLKLEVENPNAAMTALNACQQTLTEVSTTLKPNPERLYGRQALEELETIRSKTQFALTQQTLALTNDEARQIHLEQHLNQPRIDCPECGHSWTLVPKQHAEYQAIMERRPHLLEQIKSFKEMIVNYDARIVATQEYIATYRQYIQCVKSWEILQPFWTRVQEEDLLLSQPNELIVRVHQFRDDLRLAQEAATLTAAIVAKQQLIQQSQTIQQGSLDDQLKRDAVLQQRITERQTILVALRQQAKRFTQYLKLTTEGLALQQSLLATEQSVHQQFIQWAESLWQTWIEEEIRQCSEQLAIRQKTLMEYQHGRRLISELEAQIQKAQVEEEASRAIMDALSPTEGLIAEGMLGFIRHFVEQMNQRIAEVWSYPLTVEACRLDEEDDLNLDYKFPLIAEHADLGVTDVSMGSSSQIQMINLAFVVTAMIYLGLEDSPLFLDEFGSGFDDAHRFESIGAIQNLLTRHGFTQLFMVSHYEMTYSAFSDAQICVLDKSNITLPSQCVYNQHVDMTMAI